jgi:hypothetical protein
MIDRVDLNQLNWTLAMRRLFIPVTIGAILALGATLSPWFHEAHLMIRVFLFCAACFPLIVFWKQIEGHQKIALSITATIHNPILLVQLGSGLAWIVVSVIMFLYFGKQIFRSTNSNENHISEV